MHEGFGANMISASWFILDRRMIQWIGDIPIVGLVLLFLLLIAVIVLSPRTGRPSEWKAEWENWTLGRTAVFGLLGFMLLLGCARACTEA